MSEDGAEIQAGKLGKLDIPSGQTKTIMIPFKKPDIRPGSEYFLCFSVRLKEDWLESRVRDSNDRQDIIHRLLPDPYVDSESIIRS